MIRRRLHAHAHTVTVTGTPGPGPAGPKATRRAGHAAVIINLCTMHIRDVLVRTHWHVTSTYLGLYRSTGASTM